MPGKPNTEGKTYTSYIYNGSCGVYSCFFQTGNIGGRIHGQPPRSTCIHVAYNIRRLFFVRVLSGYVQLTTFLGMRM